MPEWERYPHRRYNPLLAQWVLVSPHRTERPWQGERGEAATVAPLAYDPNCYLCPGNSRAGGERNPDYASLFVFENDFAALLPDLPPGGRDEGQLFIAKAERGVCRVVCFSPRHDLHLAAMPVEEVRRVVDTWAEQYAELTTLPFIEAVTIFENRGAVMGASNPHPHGQIWANASIPTDLLMETFTQNDYLHKEKSCLLCTYVARELEYGERVVLAIDNVVALVPFWAVWPFEVMIVPRAHRAALPACDPAERDALAITMREMVARYDRLFAAPFPYSMGFHQQPSDREYPGWHMHAHYFPPLLRSATVRKYMVGYELLGEPARDFTPELAAQRLREA
jgi:UDPglucose--hexose-1-phosphate uridylyltransferase